MEKSSSRTLEITVISGESLRVNKRKVKENAFVVVRTEFDNIQRTTSNVDEGNNHLAWHENLVINMPMHARYVTVEVQCKVHSGNKVIGTARIPVSDFVGGYVPENYLQFLSYRLRDGKGERNGIINLSVRVKKLQENGGCSSAANRTWPWSPAQGFQNGSNGIAVGIPVWYQSQV